MLVNFYEKPGCANNTRQRRLLEAAGCQVLAHDLLSEPWTAERLRAFFGDRPVAQWFNRAAPRVKSGAVRPDELDATTALALLLAEPLLIRRPLIEVDGWRTVGFDAAELAARFGLDLPGAAPAACKRSQPCPPRG
jgi:nitrogenase-associated protein